MEFPDNAITNVYKTVSRSSSLMSMLIGLQEGVHSIRWTLYSPADSNISGSAEEAQARRWVIDPSDGLSFAQLSKMRVLEDKLRSKDYHVLYDADRASLWVFDLPVPGSTSSQRETEYEMILRVMAEFSMKSMLKAIF